VRQALPDGTESTGITFSLGDIVLGGVVARAIRCAGWRRIKLAGFPQAGAHHAQCAGFHPDGLVFRDARKPNWQRGLKQTAAVVCGLNHGKDLPRLPRDSFRSLGRVVDG